MNKLKLLLKLLLGLFSVLLLVQGSFWAFLLFFGGIPLRGITVFIEQFVAQSSVVLIGIYISATIILLKLLASKRKIHPRRYYTMAIIGFTIAGLNSASLIITPYTVFIANAEFEQEFGPDWEKKIPEDVKQYFLQIPYLLPANFLEFPEKPVRVVKDVLYYEGEGVTLHFDAYMPIGDSSQLPGKKSIIINLHAGAWISGGKGTWNMISMSKYLAAQGYVVFDVEYGLIAGDFQFTQAPETPEYVKGDFTIEDQVRHIGIFTKRLESKYVWMYGARLDSVYLMGRSAGAHLAGVIGFGYNEDHFRNVFSNKMVIKGIIPLYTPPGAPSMFLEGNPEYDSEYYNRYRISTLADRADPPMLIFQGITDSQVRIEWVETMESEIVSQGGKCIMLKFPLAGHASDFVINSNIGQVWTYYLERFLYLTQ